MAERGPRNVADKSLTNSKQKKGDDTQIEAQDETSIGTRDFTTEREHVSDSSSPARSPSNMAKSTALKRKQRADSDEYETDETQSSSEEDSIMSDHDLPRIKLRSQGMNSSRPRTKVGSKSGRETVVRVAKKTGSEIPPRNLAYVLVPPSPHKSQALSHNPSRPLADYRDSVELTDGQHSDDFQPDMKWKAVSTPSNPSKRRKVGRKAQRTTVAVVKASITKTIGIKPNAFAFLQTHFCLCATISIEERTCQVLHYFGIYYRSDLGLLICFEHGCAVLLDKWVQHIQGYHYDGSDQQISKKELEQMKTHISANYNVAASIDDLNLPETLTTHLPMKELHAGERPSVLLRYRCPVETSCRVWSACSNKKATTAETHQLSQHIRNVHKKSIKSYQVLGPTKTQKLKIHGNHYHTFILPDDWKDDSWGKEAAVTAESSADLPIQEPMVCYRPNNAGSNGDSVAQLQVTWPTTLGWATYRNTTLRGLTFTQLRRLILIPTDRSVKDSKGCRNWLESGLLWVFEICADYLRNANLFLDEAHTNIRDEITSGSERGSFRPLSASKYREYGRVIGQTVAMTMRILHETIQFGNYQKAGLGIKCTKKQLSAAIILYQRIMEARGSPTESFLHPLHSFLATLLQPGDLTTEDFACPTDQTMFLLSIRRNGCYSLSSTVASNCAAFRYCFHSIFTHVVREKFLGLTEFKLFQPSSPSSDLAQDEPVCLEDDNPDDVEDTDDDEDESQERPGDAGEVEEEDLELALEKIMQRSYSLCSKLDIHPESTESTKTGDNSAARISVVGYIKSEKYCVTTRDQYGRSTPFSRIHFVWATVNHPAREQPGSMEFTSLADGHRWTFHRSGNEPQEITLRTWSSACTSAIENFVDALKCLLFNSNILNDFKPQHMTDVKTMNPAPHRQIQNQGLTTAYRERLETEIFATLSTDNRVDPIKAGSWFEAEQAALTVLASILCLTGGVSFRGWQLSSIRYDSSDSEKRNVWIVDETCVVSHPIAKQRHVAYAPTLLAFPRSMTAHLILYLYYVRPIACSILKALNRDDTMHSTLLWVNPMPTKHSDLPSPWDGKCISTCLRSFTAENMGIQLTPQLVRQISQAVMRDKFPQLFSASTQMKTTLAEYGQICEFPPWHDLQPDRAACLLAVSQIWQAMLGIGPVMPVWLPIVDGSHIFPSDCSNNCGMAFISAKRLLADQLQVNEMVLSQGYSKLLETKATRRDLLTPIVAELMFGNSATRIEIDLPLFGLHSELVAKAIQIVVFAASHSTLEFDVSMLESEAMIGVYNSALECIQALRAEADNTAIWDRLGQDVYGLHKIPHVATAGAKEEDSLLSIIHRLSEMRG